MSALGLRSFVAAGLCVGSALSLVLRYNGVACFWEGDYEPELFLSLAVVFSLGFIWLVSEIVLLLAAKHISEPSPMVRLQALGVALGVHFAIGLAGAATFPNLQNSDAGAWIPLWIIGSIIRAGVLRECQ